MKKLLGIGLAVPCPVDPSRPNRLSARVLPAWSEVAIHRELHEHFALPLLVDNDANLGALAELWWGGGVGHSTLAFIKLGTGVGCGLVFDGKVFHGSNSLAGELGHISLDPNGPACECGRKGCLVTYVGAKRLVEQAQLQTQAEQSEPPPRTIGDLLAAVANGCPSSREIVATAGEQLARAVANIVNMVNPDVVIVGGSVARAGDTLMSPVAAALKEQRRWTSEAGTKLFLSTLGASGIALGAATYVLQEALEHFSYFEQAPTL